MMRRRAESAADTVDRDTSKKRVEDNEAFMPRIPRHTVVASETPPVNDADAFGHKSDVKVIQVMLKSVNRNPNCFVGFEHSALIFSGTGVFLEATVPFRSVVASKELRSKVSTRNCVVESRSKMRRQDERFARLVTAAVFGIWPFSA